MNSVPSASVGFGDQEGRTSTSALVRIACDKVVSRSSTRPVAGRRLWRTASHPRHRPARDARRQAADDRVGETSRDRHVQNARLDLIRSLAGDNGRVTAAYRAPDSRGRNRRERGHRPRRRAAAFGVAASRGISASRTSGTDVKFFARTAVSAAHAHNPSCLNDFNGWRRGWDSNCFRVLIAKNLADLLFLQFRQIRTKAEIETRIEHAACRAAR